MVLLRGDLSVCLVFVPLFFFVIGPYLMEDWAVTILVVGVVVGVAIVALLSLRHCRQRHHDDELVSPLDQLEAAHTHPPPLHHHSNHDTTPPLEVHPAHGAFDTDNPYEVLQAEARLAGASGPSASSPGGIDAAVGFIPRTASKLDKRHLPHDHESHGGRAHGAAQHPPKPHREESRSHIGHRYDPDVERVQDAVVTSYNLEETAQLQAHYHHNQRQSVSSAAVAPPAAAHHVAHHSSVDATPVPH